jgi:hypothetical protein
VQSRADKKDIADNDDKKGCTRKREKEKKHLYSTSQSLVFFWTGPKPCYFAKIKISSRMEHGAFAAQIVNIQL